MMRPIPVLAVMASLAVVPFAQGKEEKPSPVRNLTQVDAIAVTVDPAVFHRDNLADVCTAALTLALKQHEFTVVANTLGADAVLTLKGSALIITEGKPKDIGKTVLNYVAIAQAGATEKALFTTVGWARGDTAAEACNIGAEEIASKLSEAKGNTDEDEGMEEGEEEKERD